VTSKATDSDAPQDPADLLAELGEHPDMIAARLAAECAWGVPGSRNRCPLAKYLRRKLGTLASVDRDGAVLGRPVRTVPLPVACRSFVRKFDKGRYPELVEPAVRREWAAAGYQWPAGGANGDGEGS
jgi:hypothetical protein